MRSKVSITNQKHVFFKSFKDIRQIDEAITLLQQNNTTELEWSVLGRFEKNIYDNKRELEQEVLNIKSHWDESFNSSIDFGYFENPDIGMTYIVGPLTSIFLHKVDEISLAVMSSGVYGILRGLGAHEEQTNAYLNFLKMGSSLLILRGFDYELFNVLDKLEELN